MTTDTSERGLERLICTALTGHACDPPRAGEVAEPQLGYGGVGWTCGNPNDYDREYCVDLAQLRVFLGDTQPETAESLALDVDSPIRLKFLARLQGEISKRGTIDVLRHGIKHGAHDLDLFYGTPSAENEKAKALYEANRFSVTRQFRYSRDETQLALDLGLFINGLPIATFELKNSLTKQTVEDAVWQYKKDRNPREKLFEFGRCVSHFAVDDHEVRFCTQLKGKASWFLPFNLGWNDGAGNPPNPDGIKTDFMWKRVLTRESLTNILENYAQVVESKDEKTGRKKKTQIWPRYQQLDVERYLGGADRDRLDPILDACVAVYKVDLDEDGQVDFKAKAFIRTYGFLSSILPYTNADWEKHSVFLNFLVPKLPAPKDEDLSKGILEAIDMDSYRVEKQTARKILLPDEDAEIESVPTTGGGRKPEPEMDRLSNIIKTFNDQFGNIPWSDADRVHKLITEDIPNRVAADRAYQNAKKNSDKQNARIEHDKALQRVMTAVLKDDTELFKQFMDNESFRRWMADTVFGLTYEAYMGG